MHGAAWSKSSNSVRSLWEPAAGWASITLLQVSSHELDLDNVDNVFIYTLK